MPNDLTTDILCGTLFGIASLLASCANDFRTLALCRLATGIGIGDAGTAIVRLTSECVQARLRGSIATIMWAALRASGIVGGFAAASLLPLYGWPSLFLLAGAASLLFVILIPAFVPESIQYLVASGAASLELRKPPDASASTSCGARPSSRSHSAHPENRRQPAKRSAGNARKNSGPTAESPLMTIENEIHG
ncbi:MAG: MFS transporter [Altererythrobacter sp.]|nr:MFS transporter [Altererythrobacter sp.]